MYSQYFDFENGPTLWHLLLSEYQVVAPWVCWWFWRVVRRRLAVERAAQSAWWSPLSRGTKRHPTWMCNELRVQASRLAAEVLDAVQTRRNWEKRVYINYGFILLSKVLNLAGILLVHQKNIPHRAASTPTSNRVTNWAITTTLTHFITKSSCLNVEEKCWHMSLD